MDLQPSSTTKWILRVTADYSVQPIIYRIIITFTDGKDVFFCSMINADFCTGSVLISFGAILGKTSPVQLLVMAVFEVTLFAVNEFILLSLLGVSVLGILLDRKIVYWNIQIRFHISSTY